jgi:hypothetical protein
MTFAHSSNHDVNVLIEGHIPWDVILGMIKHRSLKELHLGQNKFEDRELPPALDLNGLIELDLSGIESLGGKITTHIGSYEFMLIIYLCAYAGCLPQQASSWKTLKKFKANGTLLKGKTCLVCMSTELVCRCSLVLRLDQLLSILNTTEMFCQATQSISRLK